MSTFTRALRSSLLAALLISGCVLIMFMGLRRAGLLESLELTAYDWFITMPRKTMQPGPRIVMIEISEKDIAKLGQWPLTDASLAQVLKVLIRCRPRAIGIDIYRDIAVPPGHAELNSVLTSNPELITVMKFGDGGIAPPPVLRNTEQIGFNDLLVDPGGIVRRALLFLDDGETVVYSFALRLALLYLQAEGIVPEPDVSNPEHIRLGKTTLRPLEPNDGGYVQADTRGYQFLLDYRDSIDSFPAISLTSLLSGAFDPQLLANRVVLIGVTAQDVKDFFYTPYSRYRKGDQQVSGITLHAHILSQLLRLALDESLPIETPREMHEMFWVLLWAVMGGAVGCFVRSPWRFSLVGVGGLLVLFATAYLAILRGWWLPLVPPALNWLVSAAIVTAYMSNLERKERALLMQIFSRHVSQEVAENIWQQRDQFLDGGRPRPQKMIATILFSDMKGFTPIAERMDPLALIDWLNTYMEKMTQIVMEHGGVVDDYAGDGIKANFGVPIARTREEEIREDAINAVSCALAMEREMQKINTLWLEQRLPTVGMRIGIFTGPVVAGALGSDQRLKYTTIGNAVNIAARLESYDKDFIGVDPSRYPCRILIGEATLHHLDHRFKTQRVGEVKLRGQNEEIALYCVIGQEDESTECFREVMK